MIDTVTGWSKITEYNNICAIKISNLVDTMGLAIYIWTKEIMYGQGSEFIGCEFIKYLIEREYGILFKSVTSVNPTYNVILEQIHAVLGNIVWSYNIKDTYVE